VASSWILFFSYVTVSSIAVLTLCVSERGRIIISTSVHYCFDEIIKWLFQAVVRILWSISLVPGLPVLGSIILHCIETGVIWLSSPDVFTLICAAVCVCVWGGEVRPTVECVLLSHQNAVKPRSRACNETSASLISYFAVRFFCETYLTELGWDVWTVILATVPQSGSRRRVEGREDSSFWSTPMMVN